MTPGTASVPYGCPRRRLTSPRPVPWSAEASGGGLPGIPLPPAPEGADPHAPRSTVTLRQAVAETRHAALAPAVAIVILIGATIGLAGLLHLSQSLHFSRDPIGVYGWVAHNHYPKQQETFYFRQPSSGSLCSALAYLAWVAGISSCVCRATGANLRRVLWQSALASLCFLATLPRLSRLDPAAWAARAPSAAVFVGLLLCCFIYNRRFPAIAESTSAEDQAGIALQADAPRDRPSEASRPAWHALYRIAAYAAVPALLYALLYNPVIDGRVDLFQEGEYLGPLNELLHGAVPYRDIYVQHGLFQRLIPRVRRLAIRPDAGRSPHDRAPAQTARPGRPLRSVPLPLPGRMVPALVMAWIAFGAVAVPLRAFFGLVALAFAATAVKGPRGLALLDTPPAMESPRGGGGSATRILRDGRPLLMAGIACSFAFWHSVEVGFYDPSRLGFLSSRRAPCRPASPGNEGRSPSAYAIGLAIGFTTVGWYFSRTARWGTCAATSSSNSPTRRTPGGSPFPPSAAP